MSAGGSYGKSESQSPFEERQKDVAEQLFRRLATTKELPEFAGIPSQFSDLGEQDILAALLGNAPGTSPLAGGGQTVRELLETGAPVSTEEFEEANRALLRRQVGEESADLRERAGIAGTRFSTQLLGEERELSRRSLEDYLGIVAPLRFQAREAAAARRYGTAGLLGQLGIAQRGQRQNLLQLALEDQRRRELGLLPLAIQFLSAGIPRQRERRYAAQAGIGGGGSATVG